MYSYRYATTKIDNKITELDIVDMIVVTQISI